LSLVVFSAVLRNFIVTFYAKNTDTKMFGEIDHALN
jgi:hypothetical protein